MRQKIGFLGGALFLAALGLRCFGLSQGIPDSLHPDETIVVHRALYFGSGDLNPHMFHYPSFAMYVTSVWIGARLALFWITGTVHSIAEAKALFANDPAPFFYAARLGMTVFSALIPLTLFLWGRRSLGFWGALIAAGIAVLTPNLLVQGHFAKPDALMTWLALLSFLSCGESVVRKSASWAYGAAALAGLAFSTKYNAVPLAPVVGTAILIVSWDHPHRGFALFKRWMIAGGFFLAAFALGSPYVVLDGKTFLHDFRSIASFTESGGEARNLLARTWLLLSSLGGNGWFALGIWGGMVGVFLSRGIPLLLSASAVIIFLGFVARQSLAYPRYLDPVLPIALFAVGGGVAFLWEKGRPRGSRALGAAVLGTLLISGVVGSTHLIRSFRQPTTAEVARVWILENVENGARLIKDAGGPQLPHSRAALLDLLEKAQKGGHPKASLFALQLQSFNPEGKHFDVYLSSQAIVFTPPDLLEYSRSAQRLFPVDRGVDFARREGIRYVVVSDAEAGLYAGGTLGGKAHPAWASFYNSLESAKKSEMIFDTSRSRAVGPRIRIYRLDPIAAGDGRNF